MKTVKSLNLDGNGAPNSCTTAGNEERREKRAVPVFVIHCEFSSKRGPKFYRQIRNLDRSLNVYPQLSFPQLFILKGGFEGFYNVSPHLCVGEDLYRPMLLPQYYEELQLAEKQASIEWRQLQLTKNLILGNL